MPLSLRDTGIVRAIAANQLFGAILIVTGLIASRAQGYALTTAYLVGTTCFLAIVLGSSWLLWHGHSLGRRLALGLQLL